MNDAAQTTGSSTHMLADFTATLRFEQIPSDVLARAKLSLLDTRGCCLQGSTCPAARKLQDFVRNEGGRPVASILGAAERTSPTLAALVNGTAGHAFPRFEFPVSGLRFQGLVAALLFDSICLYRRPTNGLRTVQSTHYSPLTTHEVI